jgi:GT2 family glycosyltransferase
MEAPSTASVVICAYTMDRWPVLIESVESVRAQSHAPAEIILVIDHEAELLALAQERFEDVDVVANASGPGIQGGRNTGCARATGAVIAFLDDDAIAEPEWLARLLACYTDDTVLGVGGRVLPDWRAGRPGWFPEEFNWVVGCSWTGLPETTAEVRNPIGASLSVRREVFLTLGGFAPEMGRVAGPDGTTVTGTADETEFCIRAARLHPGGRWLYTPEAVVHHVVAESRLSWRFFVGRCRMEGDSKALLAGLAGAEKGLESERRYVRSVLPLAVLRDLAAGARGDWMALRRAGAIVIGLAVTAGAYIRRRASTLRRRPTG